MSKTYLEDQFIDLLKQQSYKASQLFMKININEHEGRDALASLIDKGLVIVDREWRLHYITPKEYTRKP